MFASIWLGLPDAQVLDIHNNRTPRSSQRALKCRQTPDRSSCKHTRQIKWQKLGNTSSPNEAARGQGAQTRHSTVNPTDGNGYGKVSQQNISKGGAAEADTLCHIIGVMISSAYTNTAWGAGPPRLMWWTVPVGPSEACHSDAGDPSTVSSNRISTPDTPKTDTSRRVLASGRTRLKTNLADFGQEMRNEMWNPNQLESGIKSHKKYNFLSAVGSWPQNQGTGKLYKCWGKPRRPKAQQKFL